MIPTIILDMPTNFVIGHLLMYLAKNEIQQTQETWTTPLKLSWLYSAFIFCPITGWSFYAYPAWATCYLRPEFLIPAWAGPVIVSHYFVGMVFGTLLAQHFIQKNKMKWFWSTLGLGTFWLLSLTVLTFDEYQHIGTYNTYHAGQAKLISDSPEFMTSLNIMGAAIALPGTALGYYLWKRNRKFVKNS